MQDVGWVVKLGLQRAVDVGEAGRRTAEAHALAQIVPSLLAEGARTAVNARLDGDALPDLQGGYGARCNGGDDPGSLMSEYKRCPHSKIAISSMGVVVHCED